MYNKYLNQLEKKYRSSWDVSKNIKIDDFNIDLLSKFSAKFEKYVLSKKASIGSANTVIHDIVLAVPDGIELSNFHKFEQLGKNFITENVMPKYGHIATDVRIVLISAGYSEEIARYAKRYKYTKSYLMGLKGWSMLIFVLVDLEKHAVYAHRGMKAKEKEIYLPDCG